ncbi:unnamed protein product [Brassicogethes aeneus]|uniref:C2H2-type domain-containing protein n=1 Tax=Brassicogethes aeneus TaxID=1431903 RepID=A0A9P0ARS3_BRAAE|nr:unnamed protein product [Brassicogethes aeneus]
MYSQSINQKSELYPANQTQINNAYPQDNVYDIYSSTSAQVYNTHPPAYSAAYNGTNWDSRIMFDADKSLKIPDKIDMIEITSKDLSPVSYCSDLIQDVYKYNNVYNKCDNQWYYPYNQYPSCAQVSKSNTNMQNMNKYCSIQKNSNYCDYSEQEYYKNSCQVKNVEPSVNNLNLCNQFEKFQENYTHTSNFYSLNDIPFEAIHQIDQNTEDTNEESDIIVEESDDDVTDFSEDHENISNKCIICNLGYAPMGRQFYFLTMKSPLAMTTQKPVYNKIISIVGKIRTKKDYICSECLGLLNTIDHLTVKLNNFKQEILSKFQKTCESNNIGNVKKRKNKLLKMPRFKCKTCKKIVCIKQFLNYHLKRHKLSNTYLCELCGLSFQKYILFKRHKLSHKTKYKPVKRSIIAHKCTNCKKNFKTKTNFTEHQNFCLGILPFNCTDKLCDKKFASSTKLKNHIKLKHEKKFIAICSICNIGFIKLSDYKSHKITHSADKKFSCEKCGKNYKTLSNLNFHMKVHSDKLPFICELCDKGFLRKDYLEAHINNHNGVKNYNCNVCSKKFVSQKNLDAHLKYHDGTVKIYKCNICGKSMSSGFEEHLRTHSNVREFECTSCDMKFKTKGSLSKHVKIKHEKDIKVV